MLHNRERLLHMHRCLRHRRMDLEWHHHRASKEHQDQMDKLDHQAGRHMYLHRMYMVGVLFLRKASKEFRDRQDILSR